jgi:spore coat polysaccharide biosynthesis protein SpsF
MGSMRLPGKVLMDLHGQPILAWVLNRLSCARTISHVIVATTTDPRDDSLEAWCGERGWAVFRGSEDDVLDRYCGAARHASGELVVRITSDCPLIDPGVVDAVVAALVASPPADYASNVLANRTFPRGLDTEAFTRMALETAGERDRSPASREHVTPYLYRHPAEFRLRSVRNAENHSDLRWTVDTPEDLAYVRSLVDRAASWDAAWTELLAIARAHPELAEINRGIQQKSILEEARTAH